VLPFKIGCPAQKPIRFGNRFADDDRDRRFLISRIEHCLAISLQTVGDDQAEGLTVEEVQSPSANAACGVNAVRMAASGSQCARQIKALIQNCWERRRN
jgi:hypothetical protein